MLDLATVFNAQPNALEQGHYVVEVSVYSEHAKTQTMLCDLWYSGEDALITDDHEDHPLADTILQQRKRAPEEGTLHDEVPPV